MDMNPESFFPTFGVHYIYMIVMIPSTTSILDMFNEKNNTHPHT